VGDSDTTTLSAESALDSIVTTSADLVTGVAFRQTFLQLIEN